LLKEIAPSVNRAAVLCDPAIPPGIGQFAIIQSVAPSLGVELPRRAGRLGICGREHVSRGPRGRSCNAPDSGAHGDDGRCHPRRDQTGRRSARPLRGQRNNLIASEKTGRRNPTLSRCRRDACRTHRLRWAFKHLPLFNPGIFSYRLVTSFRALLCRWR
jgi:hypothetical protein